VESNLNDRVRDEVSECGFAFVGGFERALSAQEVAAKLGDIFTLPGAAESQVLLPRAKEQSTPNTYSGNYGRGEFPLHTDLAHWVVPPRYLLLRCVVGAEGVATRLLDGNGMVASIGASALRRAIVQPRRPLAGNRALLRLLDSRGGTREFLRWDQLFLVPATPAGAVTFGQMLVCLARVESTHVTLAKAGDTLLIDNWRMLHGRSLVGPEHSDRRIDRVYLDKLY
jgi:alpha-ketoglutarate-dependent taurine dioxygenase